MRQKLVERRHLLGRVRLEAFRSADKLEQVLDPRFALLAFFLLEEIDETARVNDVVDFVLQAEFAGIPGQALNQIQKCKHGIGRTTGKLVACDRAGRAPHWTTVGAGIGAHQFNGARADAACRFVHDTFER